MTIEKVREIVDSAPFIPFVIHLADGRQVPVEHRDFISISRTGRILNVFYGPRDASMFVDVLLITAIEVQNGGSTSEAHA